MRETAEFIFSTSRAGTRVIRVPDPLPGIPTAAIEMVEGMFLTANPFDETVGSLVALKRAHRVTVTRLGLIEAA